MEKASNVVRDVRFGHTPPEPLFTKNELARHLRLNPRTLDNWKAQEKGPRAVKIGRKLLYRESEVRRWIENEERRQHGE